MEPITRKEKYLAAAAGDDVQIPDPITREEMYLSRIAGGSENWELICEGEVAENVTDITISADKDGNPLSLKKAVVYAQLYTHTSNAAKRITFYSGDIAATCGTTTSVYVDKFGLLYAEATIMANDTLEASWGAALNGSAYGSTPLEVALQKSIPGFTTTGASGLGALLAKNSATEITKITIDSNIKVGSAYKIYGVRA